MTASGDNSNQTMVSDQDQMSSGQSEEQQPSVKVSKESSGDSDTVKYETYKKVVGEAKSLRSKLEEYEAQKQADEEKKMKAEKRYDELLAKRDAENKKLAQKLADIQNAMVRSLKTQALERELGGVQHPDYLKFADMDRIHITESGEVDPGTLKEVANLFRAEHPTLLKRAEKILPVGTPKPAFQLEPVEPDDLKSLARKRMMNQGIK